MFWVKLLDIVISGLYFLAAAVLPLRWHLTGTRTVIGGLKAAFDGLLGVVHSGL